MTYRYVVQVFDDDGLIGWLRGDGGFTRHRRERTSWGTRSGAEGAVVFAAAMRPDLIGRMAVKRRTMEQVISDSRS